MSQSAAIIYNTALIILEDCMLLLLAMGLFSKKRTALVVGISFFALAILLYYFCEMTYEQIAEIEKCSYPTVRRSVLSAMERD